MPPQADFDALVPSIGFLTDRRIRAALDAGFLLERGTWDDASIRPGSYLLRSTASTCRTTLSTLSTTTSWPCRKSLAEETLQCGVQSMQDVDKVQELGIRLSDSEVVNTPGLADAIAANVELVKEQVVKTGDHALLIGKVAAFRVNSKPFGAAAAFHRP